MTKDITKMEAIALMFVGKKSESTESKTKKATLKTK